MKQFGNPLFLRRPPAISTNPPISDQFFHYPLFVQISKTRTPPPPANFTGEETMKKLHKIHKIEENQTLKIQNIEKTENEEDIENLKI